MWAVARACAVVVVLLTGWAAAVGADAATVGTRVLPDGSLYTGREPTSDDALHLWNVTCSADRDVPRVVSCHPERCARRVLDNLVSDAELQTLIGIAKKGMAFAAAAAGPTILDINSGLMRDAEGIKRVYPHVKYSAHEYAVYAGVFDKIRAAIMATFGNTELWFTAPTFITRLIGEEGWEPASMHDVYYTNHSDKVNTEHYDYSGLLYLSTYEDDFTGGKFSFFNADGTNHTIEPRAGRFLTFSSGEENWHQVAKVESGVRFTMSMWFTCDSRREFTTFLDGEVHQTFRRAGELEEPEL